MGRRAAGSSRGPGAGERSLARLILDTTILVDAERGGDALAESIDDDDDVAVAAITAAELRVGVEMAKGARRKKRAQFVTSVLDAVVVEPYDLQVAEAHAALLAHVRRKGTPRGAHDLIIAATARAREREVVSFDRSGFAELPGVSLADLD
ncbi:MAG TPA: PIN domain-containing protein [Solirubrobacterales bacterium]|nr:PIN domain-containing protein [Solirubrobacterales bacterium]